VNIIPDSWENSVNRYEIMVKKLADIKSSELIPNGGTAHAEVLIENIFAHAQDVVRIFSGQLNARIYGSSSVIDEAREFLQSGVGKRIKVLVQDLGEEKSNLLKTHKLISMCLEVDPGACEFKTVAEEDKSIASHFVIMDDLGYRLEPDKSKSTGVGCFNDRETAIKLNSVYDDMFERADTIQLN